jgi:serine/threonine-protein kinase
MALSPGTRLGSYEIADRIGLGGMGEVSRATDTNLKRAVAIKVLPQSLDADVDRLARFQREAEVLASLNHANIAAIYGLERSSGTTALVMELVEGPTLADRIAQGPIPVDEALPIAHQIAEALEAAHGQGVVHRDLKPANIKVRPEGTVKVLDFGLAKAFEPAAISATVSRAATITTPAMTQAGLILGTAAYMSPEQARGKAVDTRTDVWAFGCVLFEMLTGTRAFDAEDVSLTLSMVLQREPDFAALPPTVPSHVRQTVRVCLRKDPRERPRDMHDVSLAMDGAFQTETVTVPPPVAPVAQRRLLWAALAAVLLLAAISSYGWWRTTRPVERPLTRLSVDLGSEAVRAPRDTLALSPDGTRLVFVGLGSERGTRQLFTRRLDEPAALPLPGTAHGPSLSMPFFSPAGDWVAFLAGNSIRKVSVQGGSIVEVAQVPPTVLGASWGDDGNIVVTSSGQTGLLRVPSSGGTVELWKAAQTPVFFPYVLPGSRTILFNVAASGVPERLDGLRIDAVAVATGETKTLVNGGYEPRYIPTSGSTGHLVFVRQGALFAVPFDPSRLEIRGTPTPLVNDVGDTGLLEGGAQFTFSTNGTFVYLARPTGTTNAYPISWMNASGQLTPLIAQPGTYTTPRVSPDGSRLAYTAAGSKGGDLWIYDLGRGASTQVTFTGLGFREVAWAPDSRHLVYGDGASLWWIRADGSGQPQRILEKASNPRPSSFSPDGRLVYSPFGTQGLPDIWTLPVDLRDPEHPKPGKAEPFLSEPAVEVDPAFSPDGKFIAYASTELGPNEVFVRPFPGPGGKWKVSTTGGKFPAWAATTRELFFVGGDDRIMVASYTINGDSFVASPPRPFAQTQVLRDGVRQNFDVTPDGKRVVVFPRPMETSSEAPLHATFLLNFFDEVRRRVP